MASFPYGSDVGAPSIAGIEALAHSSGVQFSVTSDYRPGDPGYHGSQNAVDMASSAGSMVTLAAYLYQYSPYLLELIHSGGPGFFVKNGVRNYKYPSDIVQQHFNHVHCAATMSGLKAASQGKLTIPDSTTVADDSKKGCLTPTVATAIITVGGLYWILDLWILR